MSASDFQFACLLDPRLSAHATGAQPVWLWSEDATRILWANPTGAAVFKARTPSALAALHFEPQDTAAAQIVRLAATLSPGAAPRLERLRGFGASVGGVLTCACSRLALDDGTSGILVVSTERSGREIPLGERVRWLLSECDAPVAAFAANGEPIHATPAIQDALGGAQDLASLGADTLAAKACAAGHAAGDIAAGKLSIARIGSGAGTVLLATLDARNQPAEAAGEVAPAEESAPPSSSPVETAPEPPAQAAAEETEASAEVDGIGPERRYPLRFVWDIDSAGRFTVSSDEFARLIGSKTASYLGKPWSEIAAALGLDAQGEVARALATRDTWSGIITHWPVDGGGEPLAVELSGLPSFDRERNFQGYRGFGVCRDVRQLETLTVERASAPISVALPETGESAAAAAQEPPQPLSPGERTAFHEIARQLSDRLKRVHEGSQSQEAEPPPAVPELSPSGPQLEPEPAVTSSERPILDRLPVGILVYRFNDLLYANRAFLDWTGYPGLHELAQAGGLDTLFVETGGEVVGKNGSRSIAISTHTGEQKPVEGRLFSSQWDGENALVLMLNIPAAATERSPGPAVREAEIENRELKAILDTATDGVLLIDRDGRLLSANHSAQALFGYDSADFKDLPFSGLFAPESRAIATAYLDRLANDGAASVMNEGRDVIGTVRQGGMIPLYLTLGRIGEAGEKFCAVFRDMSAWKTSEEELIRARRQAESASSAKSEFLAKISHEIRTPLNAIIGFSEVMMEERFGPIGNERYRDYLKDIHASGEHLISLINDLLDLSKIEAGKLELSFAGLNLNDLVQQCVAIMQQQANRERVIIRTSLPANLPQVIADARSLRQIVLNLLSNSIKFTGAGGQIIVSTAMTDEHDVVLRVRDTGAGMNEADIQTAMEPFRQLATTARTRSNGTGLGLPITKALAEANHARFTIKSEVGTGTLIEIAFPGTRVLAE